MAEVAKGQAIRLTPRKVKVSMSRARKADLRFCPSVVWLSFLATQHAKNRHFGIDTVAAVYLAAVLEYLATEVLEASGEVAKEKQKDSMTAVIGSRDIKEALSKDKELQKLFRKAMIVNGREIPNMEELSNLLGDFSMDAD